LSTPAPLQAQELGTVQTIKEIDALEAELYEIQIRMLQGEDPFTLLPLARALRKRIWAPLQEDQS